MPYREHAHFFDCQGDALLGIVSVPDAEAHAGTGVLIVVGGPQYRVGSHRQFALLARGLAAGGVPCMRFDYRGMGDSTGEMRAFDDINDDIGAAIDEFFRQVPGLERVVLWGLCDGASAACFYAPTDARVCGAVLLNPWVRTEAGEAKVFLKHYYLSRLLDASFWKKLLSGGVSFGKSFGDLAGMISRAGQSSAPVVAEANVASGPLPERMAQSLHMADKPVLIVLSGRDFVAREFQQTVEQGGAWARVEAARQPVSIPSADHTFSSAAHRDEVCRITADWLKDLDTTAA